MKMAPSITYDILYIKECVTECEQDRPVDEKMRIATRLFDYLAGCLDLLAHNRRFRAVTVKKMKELKESCQEEREKATSYENNFRTSIVEASFDLENSLSNLQNVMVENHLL